MRNTIDLNCDVGETNFARDAELLPLISSCNISCGAHAGDVPLMTNTVREAVRLGLAIGAHPSYPDRETFGRVSQNIGAEQLAYELICQCDLLRGIVRSFGGTLHHIKPHGALYHDLAHQPELTEQVLTVVTRAFPQVAIYGMAASSQAQVCQRLGIRFIAEGFADRRYESVDTLVSRTQPHALIESQSEFAAHFNRLLRGEIIDRQNHLHHVSIETICLHGDAPNAKSLATAAHILLEAAHVQLAPPAH